ncbi:hypothetical protein M153_6500022428 [Pseudoloma neurophilia]|uniref:Uncharacterized protein n=1 Tax=Pseudoloma neurophilia TaxID=146866 RepID=A0A0R0M9R0_9MICR|nr:hypothetical protein M153_6500022428 [Pseudoloma neurophilia]
MFIESEKLLKEIEITEKTDIEQNLDYFFYLPKKLSQILKIFHKKGWKSIKMLKAAIFLQKIKNGKISWRATNYIDKYFGLTHDSLLKSNLNQSENNNEIKFISYNFENVISGLQNKKLNLDCRNFCQNLMKLYNNGLKTENISYLKDLVKIFDSFSTENKIPRKLHGHTKIHDEIFIFILLRERNFATKLKFCFSLSHPEIFKPEKILHKNFLRTNKKIKEGVATGFAEPEINTKLCSIIERASMSKIDNYFEPVGAIEQIDVDDEANALIFDSDIKNETFH